MFRKLNGKFYLGSQADKKLDSAKQGCQLYNNSRKNKFNCENIFQ